MKTSLPVLIAGLYIAAASSVAPGAVSIDIDVAPPAPRVEVIPAPRAGYVWAPGYWEWRDSAHVWIPGRWMGERHGYHLSLIHICFTRCALRVCSPAAFSRDM